MGFSPRTASSFFRYLPLAVGLLLVFSACDSNGDDDNDNITVFARFDADGSGTIDQNEFNTLLQDNFAFFSRHDADGSENFSESEFNNIALSVFDPSDDGINAEEFEVGASFFFGAEHDQEFSTYDADENGTIDDTEFNESFGATGTFDDFDTSGDDTLSPSELAQGFFRLIDLDDDSALDEEEFNEGVGTLFNTDLPQQQ